MQLKIMDVAVIHYASCWVKLLLPTFTVKTRNVKGNASKNERKTREICRLLLFFGNQLKFHWNRTPFSCKLKFQLEWNLIKTQIWEIHERFKKIRKLENKKISICFMAPKPGLQFYVTASRNECATLLSVRDALRSGLGIRSRAEGIRTHLHVPVHAQHGA